MRPVPGGAFHAESAITHSGIRASTTGGANDYLSTTRESLYSRIEPLTAEEANAARRTLAGYASDSQEYLVLADMLDLDPKWEGPVPWRSSL